MGFRRLRGVPLPYDKQGQIYFTCRNYRRERKYTRMKIDRLCEAAAGDYAGALKALLTGGETVQAVAMRCHVSPEVLSRCRRRFYLLW
jgi:hypothetical protein